MFTLLLACIIKPYGPGPEPAVTPEAAAAAQARPEQSAPAVDFEPYELELAELLSEGGVQEQDRTDRLSAAHSLSVALQDGGGEEAVAQYFEQLLEIEQRAQEQELEGGFVMDGPVIIEEPLVGEVPQGEMGEEPSLALGDAQAMAREALADGRYQDAMTVLEPYQDGPLWDSVTRELWSEGVDGFVREERERAGLMFLAAKELPMGDARTKALREVETLILGLLTFYPDSAYSEPLQGNLDMVRRELATR